MDNGLKDLAPYVNRASKDIRILYSVNSHLLDRSREHEEEIDELTTKVKTLKIMLTTSIVTICATWTIIGLMIAGVI